MDLQKIGFVQAFMYLFLNKMSKIYTGGDNTFTGKNTFNKGFSIDSSKKIINLQTPSNSTDGANKYYADYLNRSIVGSGSAEYEAYIPSSGELTLASIEGTVSSGQTVLLLAHGSAIVGGGTSGDEKIKFFFEKGSTELLPGGTTKPFINSDFDWVYQPWSIIYYGSSPNSGDVTYKLLCDVGDDLVGNLLAYYFTVIVFSS